MEQPLISIIIPVYKVEKYLKRCVDSIVNQTYKNLEIILVDDGSPDKCGEMCEELAKQDARIKVIHKENGGLSSARNAGLDNMSGEYVGFVDSDDWIEVDMYERLYNLLSSNKAQISACGLQRDFPTGKTLYFNSEYPQKQETEIFSKLQALKELIIAHKITNSACDKLFSKEIFFDLRFNENIVNEDFDLMPKCFEKIEKVVYSPHPLYHYIMTDESITRGVFKESRFTEYDISRQHKEYYKQKYPEIYGYAVVKHIEICLMLIYASSKDKKFTLKRKQLISEVKSSEANKFFNLMGKNIKIKYILSKVNIRLYICVMDIIQKIKQ